MRKEKFSIYKVVILFLPFMIIFTALYAVAEGLYKSRKLASVGYDAVTNDTRYFKIFRHRNSSYTHSLEADIDNFVEIFFNEYEKPFSLTRTDEPILITLLKDDAEFQQYASKELRQDLTFNGGFYNSIKSDIALIMTNPVADKKGLFHEITHAVLDRSAPKAMWSPWLSEGLATYFEESSIASRENYKFGGKKAEYFAFVKDALTRQNGNFLPLKNIIKSQQEQFTSETNTIYYAEAHTLVYFLLEGAGRKYRNSFSKYFLEEKKQGECPPNVFEIEIGNIDEIEKEWIKFILTGE
ncbi:MAG: hypothetical protein A2W23_05900 [Planctomycetes bacterium RBG_16_43_13]|nr:MAG: hypothetical protein A2W23_05900 [Planctomycetes bacterium RBG_16_43_13]